MKLILLSIIGILLLAFDRRPYRRIINRWSRLFHMKVKYHNRYTKLFSVDILEDTMYISRYNKAVHDDKEYLYSIAHEFGHLIDYAYKEYYFEEEELYEGITDKASIYQDEVVAWKIAKILLQDENVYDEESFAALEERCLQQYRTALKIHKPIKCSKKKPPQKRKKKRAKRSKTVK